jgi:uncharacterized protein (DUF1330 family)
MRTRCIVALSLVTGVAIGGAAIQGLHAQAKPPVYTVTEINVTDVDAYTKEFVPLMRANIQKSGGKILGSSQNVITLEGAPQKSRVAIQLWDSMEQLQAYRDSAEFKQIRKIGEKYVTFRAFVVEGLPH